MCSICVRNLLWCLLALALLSGASAVAVAAPLASYTFDYYGNPVPAAQAYSLDVVVDGSSLGTTPLREPRDVVVSETGDIFIADTGNNRILKLNGNFQLIQVMEGFEMEGVWHSFNAPVALYVTERGRLYIADRDNARLVELTTSGDFVRVIGPPQTDLKGALPEGFNYRPFKVAVDQGGRIYVLADGIYDGLIEFDVDGNFRGFLGAPLVRPTILERFWASIATKEQRSRMALFLPTEYSALDLDERGFLYVAEHNQVRRLNPSGTDVLRRNGFFEPIGDVPTAEEYRLSETIRSSSFVDIVARENGLYSVLDRQRGRVFTYESDGHLLYVFGGLGSTRDTLKVPVALDVLEDRILLVDRGGNRILVYEPTTYGKLIHAAIGHYQGGEYESSAKLWAEVLQHNFNFDMAYTGIGTALLRQDCFADAMMNFCLGNNRPQYSTAFALYRREVMAASFGKVMLGIFALMAAIVAWVKLRPRLKALRPGVEQQSEVAATGSGPVRNSQGYWASLTYAKHVIFHPFDGFWDLKHEKRGTMGAALSILGLVAVTHVVMRQYTGFIFNPRDLSQLNIVVEVISVLVPFFLWAIVNWALTTLMDGKGTLKDIVIATCYALTPFVVINLPLTVVSNYLTLQEGIFYHFLGITATLWTASLIFIGTMTIHDYDTAKNSWTCLLTIVGIGIVLFLGLLFVNVLNVVAGFVSSVYAELILRL